MERIKETLCNIGDTNRHTGIFYPKSIRNNSIPSTALYSTAANTLNRSATPKYSFGTIFIPSAPTSIIPRAIPANTPKLRYSLLFALATISITSETMDSSTTKIVEKIYIFILKYLPRQPFLFLIWKLPVKYLRFLFIHQIPHWRCILSCNSIKISWYQFFAQKERCILAFQQSMIADAKLTSLSESTFSVEINISLKA